MVMAINKSQGLLKREKGTSYICNYCIYYKNYPYFWWR
uniref:Uncharacterized protein n=1 Tax=Lepeophtheirus salmonis TaxID=72036 RepID=A0A0K2V224_LEPSM